LRSIGFWDALNLVNFNTSKTQLSVISLKHSNFEPRVTFDNDPLTTCNSLNILGLNFNSDLSWREYILELAKRASQKLNVLFRFRKFFSPYQLKTLYVSTIRPCMEYCCHIWGGSSSCLILDRVQSKAFRLISSSLTDTIPSLSHRRDVASLSLSSIDIISATALLSSQIVFLLLSIDLVLQGRLWTHTNTLWPSAKIGSSVMLIPFFRESLLCGTHCLQLCSRRSIIYKSLRPLSPIIFWLFHDPRLIRVGNYCLSVWGFLKKKSACSTIGFSLLYWTSACSEVC
jgi:hypothetical protein